jgi:hypothetical protein
MIKIDRRLHETVPSGSRSSGIHGPGIATGAQVACVACNKKASHGSMLHTLYFSTLSPLLSSWFAIVVIGGGNARPYASGNHVVADD